jgi:hypothetical protein
MTRDLLSRHPHVSIAILSGILLWLMVIDYRSGTTFCRPPLSFGSPWISRARHPVRYWFLMLYRSILFVLVVALALLA